MSNLDWTSAKVDLIRKIKDGPGSNCLNWYKEFFSFSDANKFMGVVLYVETYYKHLYMTHVICIKNIFVENKQKNKMKVHVEVNCLQGKSIPIHIVYLNNLMSFHNLVGSSVM